MKGSCEVFLSIAAAGHGGFGVGCALLINTGVLLLGEELELFELERCRVLLLDNAVRQTRHVFALISL